MTESILQKKNMKFFKKRQFKSLLHCKSIYNYKLHQFLF